MLPADRLGVLLAAAGAPWEGDALGALAEAGIVVLRRCVDLADLLGQASTGQAAVAVVSSDVPDLDNAAVTHLLRHDVRTVAVDEGGARDRLGRLGVTTTVALADVAGLPDAVRAAVAEERVPDPDPDPGHGVLDQDAAAGRVVVVWGPAGAPGRTTVAAGLASLHGGADTGAATVLVDADPYGGTLAQRLGVLDEVSGLLAAARLANAGELDERRFAACRRRLEGSWEVLTGLPRADRWIEVRQGIVEQVVRAAAAHADVVVDTGFSLEDEDTDFGRPGGGRNRMTREALESADEVVVVGGADPVGLGRLARALVELVDVVPAARPHVVVNRMRGSLGWEERDIRGMVEGFSRPRGVHFVPEDVPTCDRMLVGGSSLREVGDSPLSRGLSPLAEALWPGSATSGSRRRARRTRGRAR